MGGWRVFSGGALAVKSLESLERAVVVRGHREANAGENEKNLFLFSLFSFFLPPFANKRGVFLL